MIKSKNKIMELDEELKSLKEGLWLLKELDKIRMAEEL